MRQIIQQLTNLGRDISGAARVTADSRSFLRLSCDFVLSKLMRVMGVNALSRHRRIHMRDGTKLSYRLNRADIYTIHELYIAEEYKIPSHLEAATIVDLGANIGLATLWLAKRHKASHVVAVEPSSANVRLLKRNLKQNGLQAKVLEAAVGASDGFAIFDSGPASTCGRVVNSSADSAPDAPGKTQMRVRVLSMASVMALLPEGAGIDLLKIDIEGGEQELLASDVPWLEHVHNILIEFHPALVRYSELLDVLHTAGFERVHSVCTNLAGGDTLELFRRQSG